MTRHVIDASVAIKWFIPNAAGEGHVPQALRILQLYLNDEIVCLQPPHFIAEMLGILTRKCPDQVADQLMDLLDMGFKVSESPEIYATASELSTKLRHHSFDTLYHAVALNAPDAILITADDAYYRKARGVGRIVWLGEYET